MEGCLKIRRVQGPFHKHLFAGSLLPYLAHINIGRKRILFHKYKQAYPKSKKRNPIIDPVYCMHKATPTPLLGTDPVPGKVGLKQSLYSRGLGNYQYHFEVHLRYHILSFYQEYGPIVLVNI